MITEFEEQWSNGKVEGWEDEGQENGHVSQPNMIDLDYYSTVEELMELGPEKLKEVSHVILTVLFIDNYLVLVAALA